MHFLLLIFGIGSCGPQPLLSCTKNPLQSVWHPLAFYLDDLFDNNAACLSLQYQSDGMDQRQACNLTVLPSEVWTQHMHRARGPTPNTLTEQYGLPAGCVERILELNDPHNHVLVVYHRKERLKKDAETWLHRVATWIAQERGASVLFEATIAWDRILPLTLSIPPARFQLTLEYRQR